MVGAVVVTHGQLGREMLEVARMIVGELPHVQVVSIGWGGDIEHSRSEIEAAVKAVDRGSGTLILTDMFGGTPSNVSLALMIAGRVEVITGVNLPMIIKLANQRDNETVADLARRVRDQGKGSIALASEMISA